MDHITDLTEAGPISMHPWESLESEGSDGDHEYPGDDGDMLLDDEEERKAILKLVKAAQAGTAAAEGSSSKNTESSIKASTQQECHMQPVKLMLQAEAEARKQAFNARHLKAAKDKESAVKNRTRREAEKAGNRSLPIQISDDDDDVPTPRPRRAKRAGKFVEPARTFRFLNLPAELRNKVYCILLTNFEPIEMTRSRRTKGLQAEKFALAKTAKARSKVKRYFLEILQTNKQIHNEATMIMYGMNVFKFRSDPKAGYLDLKDFLPEKYLRKLRRVKISVISAEAKSEQDKWVADMLNNTFSKDMITLETFELTWFAWKKYRLTADGVLCQALLNMDVERAFTIHIKGDARMETAMLTELTTKVKTRKMQIHRPVFEDQKAGKNVELSDDE